MPDTRQILEIKLDEIVDLIVTEALEKVTAEIHNRMLPKMSAHKTDNSPKDEFEYLTIDEVAQLLKVKKRTIYEWVRTKKIPFHHVGDLLRFNQSEIIAWVEDTKNSSK